MVMEGPLAPWALGMAEHLKTLGYAPLTTGRHMALVGETEPIPSATRAGGQRAQSRR